MFLPMSWMSPSTVAIITTGFSVASPSSSSSGWSRLKAVCMVLGGPQELGQEVFLFLILVADHQDAGDEQVVDHVHG